MAVNKCAGTVGISGTKGEISKKTYEITSFSDESSSL